MAKKKAIIHAPQKCGGTFLQEWNEENLPYLICDKCQHKIEDWIKWDKQYKDLWQDAAAWNEPKNHVTVLLGYFCDLYKKSYNMDYPFSFSDSGLFRGVESTMIRRLLANCKNSTTEVKEYLDWFFQYKVVGHNKKISSLSVLTVPATIGLFRHQQQNKRKITRSTPVPEGMLGWLDANAPTVKNMSQLVDFGDLQQLLRYLKTKQESQTDEAKSFLNELYKRKIINNDLEIQGLVKE